ncbi:efflux transporter outer membrane subunit [Puia dinghuensis]|nr:efflux transporter outer membrane subunit [Puia dinghuensis]
MKLRKVIVLLLPAALVVAGCKITTPYRRAAGLAGNGLYRDTTITDTTTIGAIPWRQFFTDTVLQHLIEEGLNNNLDLGIAVTRIHEAEANFRQSFLAFFPSLNANAQASLQKNPGLASTHNYEAFLNSSWQVDIWGKLRSTRRAQLAALLQSDAFRRDVQTQLVSSIAIDYYALMAFDQQLQITLATVENRKEDVITTQDLKNADVLTGAAVMQSQAGLYSVEVTIPDIRQNIRQMENTICLLLGRNPGPIARDSLYNEPVDTTLRMGLPVQLLANRPDVQEAEWQLRYYSELTNVARTYFYPALTITGEGGLSSGNLNHFFDASAFFGNLVGGLTQPIFQNGINRQRLEVVRNQEHEFLLSFEKTLLTAGQEVSNALFSYQTATEKVATRTQQIYYLTKAVDYTKELMRADAKANYTDVLTSEQNLLTAQLQSVEDRLQQLQAVVNLYADLGGGWR